MDVPLMIAKVYELILGPIKTRDRLEHGYGSPDWYYPEEVGARIIQLVEKTKWK